MMNDTTLKLHLLEAPLIIQNFVAGEADCNYEKYLTEILNASKWMSCHFSLPFIHPNSESNGECDAYADKYGLDYKLIASKTALQGRSILSMSVEKIMDGVVSFGASAKTGSSQRHHRTEHGLPGLPLYGAVCSTVRVGLFVHPS